MKINIKDSHKLIHGVWILAALGILLYNGQALMIVTGPPVLKNSKVINRIKEQRQKLEDLSVFLSDRHEVENRLDLAQIFAQYMPQSKKKLIRTYRTIKRKVVKKKGPRPKLPRVTGVLEILDEQGRKKALVVIDGKNRTVHEQIRGFTIEKITEKGVVLSKGGSNWFVARPKKDRFSITHRGGL